LACSVVGVRSISTALSRVGSEVGRALAETDSVVLVSWLTAAVDAVGLVVEAQTGSGVGVLVETTAGGGVEVGSTNTVRVGGELDSVTAVECGGVGERN